ncbi:MAG: nucleoside-diphosphate kinase [Thermoplasmatales archaeon]|nr:nucleoside-diphosphate kinase [Candidatus Thermoplasmatota archaeon]MCL6002875.1 nucleoside-diphosphate kinase [Candidatus Thermoplasmatota archaeon]MDA8056285.1 nucleoside-diphosphate kinase [Thermoplasmatales archaeon]
MRTLVLIKPDGVARSKVGEIISRFEDKGLKVTALKLMRLDKDRAERHYAVHKGKPFYDSLLNYITSAPLVAIVIEGNNCIDIVRKLVGATNGAKAEPGTIRGDFSTGIDFNLIHASDSEDSAKYEIPIFFEDREILSLERADKDWL